MYNYRIENSISIKVAQILGNSIRKLVDKFILESINSSILSPKKQLKVLWRVLNTFITIIQEYVKNIPTQVLLNIVDFLWFLSHDYLNGKSYPNYIITEDFDDIFYL